MKYFLCILALSLCVTQAEGRSATSQMAAGGYQSVVYWDCLSDGLDRFSSIDGSTTTTTGETYSAEGMELVDNGDEVKFTATNGGNIPNYDKGSISFEFKGAAAGAPTNARFFQLGTAGSDFALYRNGSDTSIRFKISDSNWDATVDDLWDGSTWNEVLVTWNTSTNIRRFYQNGVLKKESASAITTPVPTSSDFYFGCANAAQNQDCNGIVRNLRIYHEEITP